ncbi:hypothetical protein Q4566_03090 [Tamlana sp. 2_MG-2023]|uniref:hypothetical protein n=1 Tax=unclassified Tamlana TaxID=2614803 RepID=UPI0026E48696|nr:MULTISPECIES: hypothetical protein [unclassified Tamlana]MDO6759172.1 hypothetical protein [Tamlana sp. 2_MG-2023]MDO6790689.1 hypothetical protein [Tamlana sp. 1_MG-2023]
MKSFKGSCSYKSVGFDYRYDVNSVFKVGMLSGEFVLKPTENPIVFISSGIGVIPLLIMFKEASKYQNYITVIQCVANSDVQAFDLELKALLYLCCA